MDVLAWTGAVGGLVGSLGGVAGLLAYRDQHAEKRKRDAIGNLPKELRPVLFEVVEVLDQVAQTPRDRAWTTERVEPLERRFNTLASIADSQCANNASAYRMGLIQSSLVGVQEHAHNDSITSRALVASSKTQQRHFAESGKSNAASILQDLNLYG